MISVARKTKPKEQPPLSVLHSQLPTRTSHYVASPINSCLEHKAALHSHLLRSCHRATAGSARSGAHLLILYRWRHPPSPPHGANANLPAVTPQTQKQPRTRSENLSIFRTLGRRAVPFTPAGGVNWCAVVCSSASASVSDCKTGNDDGSSSFNTPSPPTPPVSGRNDTLERRCNPIVAPLVLVLFPRRSALLLLQRETCCRCI